MAVFIITSTFINKSKCMCMYMCVYHGIFLYTKWSCHYFHFLRRNIGLEDWYLYSFSGQKQEERQNTSIKRNKTKNKTTKSLPQMKLPPPLFLNLLLLGGSSKIQRMIVTWFLPPDCVARWRLVERVTSYFNIDPVDFFFLIYHRPFQ